MYSSQALTKFETKNFEQFVAQSPNLKSIEFDGYFNIDIANEFLYKIIKDRSICIIFSRNREKKTSKHLLDTKQRSLEKFLLQNPLVHAKYQTMKKQRSIMTGNNEPSETNITFRLTPKDAKRIDARLENPTPKKVPNHILYLLLFTFFVSGCYSILLAIFWYFDLARNIFISLWPFGLCLLIIFGSICFLSLSFLIYYKCKINGCLIQYIGTSISIDLQNPV